MKILLISTSDSGGAGIACKRLLHSLQIIGQEARMLILRGDHNPTAGIYTLNGRSKPGFLARQIHRVKSKRIQISRIQNTYEDFNFPASGYQVENHPLIAWADVINLHWVADFLDWRGFFEKVNKPVFWTLHDMQPWSGGYHYAKRFPLDRFSNWISKGQQIVSKAVRDRPVEVVVLNKWMLELSSNSPTFSKQVHHLIPNSIDTTVFQPTDSQLIRSENGIAPEEKVLLFVSTALDNERKGLQILLPVLSEIIAEHQLRIVTVGQRSTQLPLPGQIDMGQINDPAQIAKIYAMANIFVIPSIEDNLPNTVIESLCCGTPVVGFGIGGIPDMVDNLGNGFLAQEDDAMDLQQKLIKALQREWDRTAIAQAARDRYSPGRQASAYLEIFKRALQ